MLHIGIAQGFYVLQVAGVAAWVNDVGAVGFAGAATDVAGAAGFVDDAA